jgi:glycogen phosphorylase
LPKESEGKKMSKQSHASSPIYSFLPTEVDGFDSLAELALDLRWSWNHYADELWRQLDPDLWKITQNPWVILQTVSRDQIQRMLADPVFRKKVDALVKARREAAEAPAWFQQNYQRTSLSCVAYFRVEEPSCASSKSWLSASVDGGCSKRSAFGPKSVT